MFDFSIQKLLCCPYCGSVKLSLDSSPVVCKDCLETFQYVGGGLDLITRDNKEELFKLVKLNFEDRPDCDISSNNRQHDKEHYKKSGYLDKLLNDLNLNKESFVLDAGCGRGHISEYLVEHGFRVLSTDVVPENIKDCRNDSKILASIDNLPVLSDSFDAIICTDVLEHIYPHTQEAVLNEFYRVLKPGGKLFVSFPGNKLPAHSGHYLIDLAIFFLRRFNYSIEYIGRGYGGEAHINMRYPWVISRAFRKAGFIGKVRPLQDRFLSLPKRLVPLTKFLNLPFIRMFFVAHMQGLISKPS